MIFVALLAVLARSENMKAVKTSGLRGCKPPFSCVHVGQKEKPKAQSGSALIHVNASSVNPSDVDIVEEGGCALGCGADVAGVVVACPGCTRLKVGDQVWTNAFGAYAEYVTSPESSTTLKPSNLVCVTARSISSIGLFIERSPALSSP